MGSKNPERPEGFKNDSFSAKACHLSVTIINSMNVKVDEVNFCDGSRMHICKSKSCALTACEMIALLIDTLTETLVWTADYTVKPVLSSHSKKKTNYPLMQVKSIAECSKGSSKGNILQYFQPSLSYHWSLKPLFCLF